jgi:hypothetical protein
MLIILGIKNNYNYLNRTMNSFSITLLKLFKFLTNDKLVIAQSVIFYLLIVSTLFPIYYMTSSRRTLLGTTRLTSEIITVITISSEIIFYVSLAFVICIDYIVNFKTFICHPKKFWFDKDPFLYRLQQLILIPMAGLYIFYELFIQPDFWRLDACCLSNVNFGLRILAKSSILFSHIFYFSGFILVVTYYRKILSFISRNKNENNDHLLDSIDKIFKNSYQLKMFRDYTEKEFSLENIFLYEHIKMYEEETDQEKKRELANGLFKKFLN